MSQMAIAVEAGQGHALVRPPLYSQIPTADRRRFAYRQAEVIAFPAPHVRTRRSLLRALGYAIAVVFIVVLATPVISLFAGYKTMAVLSGSMRPTAEVGDAVILKKVDATAIKVGDVITFSPLREGGVRTHRVISIHQLEGSGLHFRTQGDANPTADPNLVPADNVVGRVRFVVPRLGRLWVFASTRLGRLVFVGLPAVLIALREVWWLLVPAKPKRRKVAVAPVIPLRPKTSSPKRRRAAMVGVAAAVAVFAIASPAAARFTDTQSTGSNALSSGVVNAPTLTSGSAQLTPCRVNLTWTAPATGVAPDGYDIYRASSSGGPYSLRKHVGAVTSGSDDTSPLQALTTYYYVIQSSRSSWRSGNSNERSVTTLLCVL